MLKTKSKHFISIYIYYSLSSVDEYVRFTFSYKKETLLHVHVDTRVGKQVYIYNILILIDNIVPILQIVLMKNSGVSAVFHLV